MTPVDHLVMNILVYSLLTIRKIVLAQWHRMIWHRQGKLADHPVDFMSNNFFLTASRGFTPYKCFP